MNIAFDAAKDAANVAKHGVSLTEAQALKWEWLWCRPDGRRDYGELREVGFAPLADRVHCVVFVQQGDVFRIISLRRANAREVNEYDQALQEFRLHHPDA
ncbi:hypothetical protein BH11PSE9_BH11PSE9_30670 [soil metagenome]